MHKCSIAVKLADTQSKRSQLPPNDVKNSDRFALLVKRLRTEQAVLILGLDKHGRFGILSPLMQDSDGRNEFAANCYVGNVQEVKEYLSQRQEPQQVVSAVSSSSNGFGEPEVHSSDGLWQPPGAEEESSGGLWQPPTADDTPSAFTTNGFDTGGVSAWQPDETNSAGIKRKLDEFHTDSGAAAADAFYSGLTRNLDTRADSRLYHMRAFNGWVKATQIQELDPRCKVKGKTNKNSRPPLRVLDLACGKGGDLGKWVLHDRGISNYVGVDVARGSLLDAAVRARQMRKKLKRCTFTCADLGADVPGRLRTPKHKVPQKLSSWSLHTEKSGADDPKFEMVRGGGISLDDKFDVVSIQFAIHYMMSSRKRARRFFQTVSQLLEVGGNLIATTIDARIAVGHLMDLGLDLHIGGDERNFGGKEPVVQVGGGACRIRFDDETVVRLFQMHRKVGEGKKLDNDDFFGLQYTFTLVEGSDHAKGVGDAVNLPEWLTPLPALESLAKEAGLELEYAQNFHDFYAERKDATTFPLAHSALYNMKVLNRDGSISGEEWEVSRLYAAVKFRKVRECTMEEADDEEDGGISDEDEAEEPPEKAPVEIDPAVAQKLLPMAMMKAKKLQGADVWQSLTSEEKKRFTQIELEKLACSSS